MGNKTNWLRLLLGIFCLLFFLSFFGCSKSTSNINKIGNTSSNIQNNGRIAQQGNWLYFSNYEDNRYLYKMQTDGKSLSMLVADSASYINVIGDWIYYIKEDDQKIYKIKSNGDEKTKLCDDPCGYLTVIKDQIYFISKNKIYSMDINGGSKKILNGEFATSLFFTDDWIYFSYNDYSLHTYYIVNLGRMKLDGSEFTKVVMDYTDISFSGKFAVNNETVYFINSINNGGLYQMKTDGSDLKEIAKGYFGTLNIADNYIYLSTHYLNSSEYSYVSKLKLDNNEYTKIYNKRAVVISIVNDHIYFTDKDSKMYQMKQDGTEVTLCPIK